MLQRILLLMIFGIFFFGCSEDLTFSDNEMEIEKLGTENPHLNGKAVTKPFKVMASGYAVPDFTTSECGDYVLFKAKGDGHANHLGKFDVFLAYCLDLSTFQVVSPIDALQTAANGDQLYSVSYTAVPVPGTTIVVHEYEYYKGTGRFEGVTGSLTLYVDFDLATGEWTAEGEGEITY